MKTLLLIVGGGIAAYKTPEIIRILQKKSITTTCILTKGGKKFITPLTLSGISNEPVYEKLFSPKDESEMGHIRLSREADAILVAPATADLIHKMATGGADDLASTTLLAADKPIYIAPAMNHRMWEHPAVQHNIDLLRSRGVHIIEPETGEMACGEFGVGRMAEPDTIASTLLANKQTKALQGKKVLITAGPTYESLDAVRFIGNYSSGKQGYALAESARNAGAEVILVSGASTLPTPAGVKLIRIQTAKEMLKACQESLPCDIAICAAAVADWSFTGSTGKKIKKTDKAPFAKLKLQETPDILGTLSKTKKHRPKLVVGFCAESENLKTSAKAKLKSKGCDIILANDVKNVFGNDDNQILWWDGKHEKNYKRASKKILAEKIIKDIASYVES